MKEEREIKDRRSILVSFLVGGVLGAGAALLLAPKAGKELRKGIKDLASDTRDRITETIEKGRELSVEVPAAVKSAIEAGKTVYLAEMEKHRKAA